MTDDLTIFHEEDCLTVYARYGYIHIAVDTPDDEIHEDVAFNPHEAEAIIEAIKQAAAHIERPHNEKREREMMAALVAGRGI